MNRASNVSSMELERQIRMLAASLENTSTYSIEDTLMRQIVENAYWDGYRQKEREVTAPFFQWLYNKLSVSHYLAGFLSTSALMFALMWAIIYCLNH